MRLACSVRHARACAWRRYTCSGRWQRQTDNTKESGTRHMDNLSFQEQSGLLRSTRSSLQVKRFLDRACALASVREVKDAHGVHCASRDARTRPRLDLYARQNLWSIAAAPIGGSQLLKCRKRASLPYIPTRGSKIASITDQCSPPCAPAGPVSRCCVDKRLRASAGS